MYGREGWVGGTEVAVDVVRHLLCALAHRRAGRKVMNVVAPVEDGAEVVEDVSELRIGPHDTTTLRAHAQGRGRSSPR